MSNVYDRRRANGPEEVGQPVYKLAVHGSGHSKTLWSTDENKLLEDPTSINPTNLTVSSVSLGEDKLNIRRMARTDILNRVNGRSALDYRPIYLQVDIIPNASGSALIECGNTKIVCAVHGPRQVRGRQYSGKAELNVQFQMAPFSLRQRQKPGKDTEKSGPASLIQQALLPAVRLELLPKSSIDVYVTVLDSDTSELGYSSLGVTAASAALAQAGVEMLGFVTGSTASLMYSLPVNGATHQQWLVDPSQSEAIHSSTHLMICTMPALGRTTCYTLQGPVQQVSSIKEVSSALVAAATSYHSAVAQALYKQK